MPLTNKRLKVAPRTGATFIGDARYGAPGGHRASPMFTLSYALADEMARDMGCDATTAHKALLALGRSAQRLLLKGTPVGIPHLGILHLMQYRWRQDPEKLAKYNRKAHDVLIPKLEPVVRTVKRVNFKMPLSLRRLFGDNAVYTGAITDHVRVAREKLKNKLPRTYRGELKHRVGVQ